MGRRRVLDLELPLDGDVLATRFGDALQDAERAREPSPAFAKFALGIAESYGIRVSKRELAEELAEVTIGIVQAAGSLHKAGGDHRPLLGRLWLWLFETR